MKKKYLLLLILLLSIFLFIFLFYFEKKRNERKLEFYEELENIPIYYKSPKENLKKYNISFIFYDPLFKGNFTIAIMNLIFGISKDVLPLPVCKYNYTECYRYTNSSFEEEIWIFEKNITYIIDRKKFLLFYIEEDIYPRIEINENRVYLYGDSKNIKKVIEKFLLYWNETIDN